MCFGNSPGWGDQRLLATVAWRLESMQPPKSTPLFILRANHGPSRSHASGPRGAWRCCWPSTWPRADAGYHVHDTLCLTWCSTDGVSCGQVVRAELVAPLVARALAEQKAAHPRAGGAGADASFPAVRPNPHPARAQPADTSS